MNHNERQDPLRQAREFWGIIVRRRWNILPATVLLVSFATIIITMLPDSYSASTTVLFDPQRLPDKYIAPTVTADPAQRLNTLTQEVLSAERLRVISQQLHLSDASKSPSAVVDQMRKAIVIDMKPNPGHDMSAFGITYSSQNPQTAAAVANRLAQSFIEWDLANRAQQAASTADFMKDQLQDAKQMVDAEESKIENYRARYKGQLPEQLQSNMQTLTLLHSRLQSNSEALDKLEQEKTMLTSAPAGDHAASSTPSAHDRLENEKRDLESELASLRAQYTEQYPDVITARERLEALNRKLSQSKSTEVSSSSVRMQIVEREITRLQDEDKNISDRIETFQSKVDATPLRVQELEMLNRNYSTVRDQYDGFLDKKVHADMALDLERQQKASRFIVDPAQVPGNPNKPNRLLLFGLAIPVCCLLPAAFIVAQAEIRGTVNSEHALRAMLPDAARVIGRIPMIETPLGARKQRQWALLSILGSFLCFLAVAVFLWGGPAARMKQNHAHHFNPANPSPSAELLSH